MSIHKVFQEPELHEGHLARSLSKTARKQHLKKSLRHMEFAVPKKKGPSLECGGRLGAEKHSVHLCAEIIFVSCQSCQNLSPEDTGTNRLPYYTHFVFVYCNLA